MSFGNRFYIVCCALIINDFVVGDAQVPFGRHVLPLQWTSLPCTLYDLRDEQGLCIPISECSQFQKAITSSISIRGVISKALIKIVKASQCGWFGKQPKVCCPMNGIAEYLDPPSTQCSTPLLEPGSCIPVKQCHMIHKALLEAPKPLPTLLVKTLRRYQCEGSVNEPKVCCPNTARQPKQVSSASSASHVTPPNVQNHPNLLRQLLPQEACGQMQEEFRIIRGDKAQLYEFPWMALIAYNTKSGMSFHCGGTLINSRYVLTAAHCITNLPEHLQLAGVRLGEYDIRTEPDCVKGEDCAQPVQDFTVETVMVHPGYEPSLLRHDIGLLRLDRPADLSHESVQPICLPLTPTLQNSVASSSRLIATGWGTTEDGTVSPVLRKVELPIVENGQCAAVYNTSATIGFRQMCAGGSAGRDSCTGDSGGPLQHIALVRGRPRIVQQGVVSFGPKQCGTIGKPAVYTRVAFYMYWILDNIRPG